MQPENPGLSAAGAQGAAGQQGVRRFGSGLMLVKHPMW